jgi:hypothetical protein
MISSLFTAFRRTVPSGRGAQGLFLLLLAWWASACVKELPVSVEVSEWPVVNCLLTNDTVQRLSLTRSVKTGGSYFFKEIRDAQITLFAGDSPVGAFERKGYDDWQLVYTPVAATVYTLKVQLSDGQALQASTTMPPMNWIIDERAANVYPSKFFWQYGAAHACWSFVVSPAGLPADIMRPSGRERLRAPSKPEKTPVCPKR